ncbi:MAG: hypothetical protein OEW08_01790, partial [Gammaproteobacteria bacterium]|nr:hypothetical protein [Gammaproteobacteria bacterium]
AIIIPLLLLYGWMSPLAQGWQPDIDGVRLGMARVASLLIFVLAVHLVNLLTDAQHWVGALYWLAYPLQWLGIARERGAVRMHLVMQHLQALQLALEKPTTARHATFWLAIVARVEGGWQWAWARAQQPVAPFQLEVNAPPLWQWCVPLGMIGLLWLR